MSEQAVAEQAGEQQATPPTIYLYVVRGASSEGLHTDVMLARWAPNELFERVRKNWLVFDDGVVRADGDLFEVVSVRPYPAFLLQRLAERQEVIDSWSALAMLQEWERDAGGEGDDDDTEGAFDDSDDAGQEERPRYRKAPTA